MIQMKNINYETKENATTLALTVRKEHRLLVINNALQTSKRISIKVIFSAITLTLLNLFI